MSEKEISDTIDDFPESTPEQRGHSLPVALVKVYGRRVIDTVKNRREGLPTGYVRNNTTAFVMAHWEDRGRSEAAKLRTISREKEPSDTTEHERLALDLGAINIPDRLEQRILDSDYANRQKAAELRYSLEKDADKGATKTGRWARRSYEMGTMRGTHSEESLVDLAHKAKANPIPRPHDKLL